MKSKAATKARPKTPLDIGVLRSIVGFHIRSAQLVVYDDFLRNAPVRGLTPGQFAILILIDQNPKITQQILAEGIGTEKSTLVVRLHRLADRGLIERVRSETDRRQNWLRLTRQGQATLEKMLDFVTRHEKKISSRLSAAERVKLVELLGKIG